MRGAPRVLEHAGAVAITPYLLTERVMTKRSVLQPSECRNRVDRPTKESEQWFIIRHRSELCLVTAKANSRSASDVVASVLGVPGPQHDKRARLIVAAPTMLRLLAAAVAALEHEIVAAGDHKHPVIRAHARVVRSARALLARIEGQR
jgi:hypothetical protein